VLSKENTPQKQTKKERCNGFSMPLQGAAKMCHFYTPRVCILYLYIWRKRVGLVIGLVGFRIR